MQSIFLPGEQEELAIISKIIEIYKRRGKLFTHYSFEDLNLIKELEKLGYIITKLPTNNYLISWFN